MLWRHQDCFKWFVIVSQSLRQRMDWEPPKYLRIIFHVVRNYHGAISSSYSVKALSHFSGRAPQVFLCMDFSGTQKKFCGQSWYFASFACISRARYEAPACLLWVLSLACVLDLRMAHESSVLEMGNLRTAHFWRVKCVVCEGVARKMRGDVCI